MNESPIPGPNMDCRADPFNGFGNPRCAKMKDFLHYKNLNYNFRYAFCFHCKNIWEASKFYQDFEEEWQIISWNEFKSKPEIWLDSKKHDFNPSAARAGTLQDFENWIETQKKIIEVQNFDL